MQNSQTPSKAPYGIGCLFMLLGPAAATALALTALPALTDGLEQVVMPGSADITLVEPGTYHVFHESRSIVDGEVYSSGAIGPTGVNYNVSDPNGELVTLTPTTADLNYSLNGRSGVGIASFEVVDGGVYSVSGAYPDGASGPDVVLAVGQGFVGELLRTVFMGLALAFTGISLGIALIFATAVRHARAKESTNG